MNIKKKVWPREEVPVLTRVAGRRRGSDPLVRVPSAGGTGRHLSDRRIQGGGEQRGGLPGEIRRAKAQWGACHGRGPRGPPRRVVMWGPVISCGRRGRVSRAPAAVARAGLLGGVRVVAESRVVVVVAGEVRVLRRGGHREVLRAEAEPRVAAHRALVRVHGGLLVQLQVTDVHLTGGGGSLSILRIQPACVPALTWSAGEVSFAPNVLVLPRAPEHTSTCARDRAVKTAAVTRTLYGLYLLLAALLFLFILQCSSWETSFPTRHSPRPAVLRLHLHLALQRAARRPRKVRTCARGGQYPPPRALIYLKLPPRGPDSVLK